MIRRASTQPPKTNWNLTQNLNYLKSLFAKNGITVVKADLINSDRFGQKIQFKFVPNSNFKYTSLTLKFEVLMASDRFWLILNGIATTLNGDKLPFKFYLDQKDGQLDSKYISEYVLRELSTLDSPYIPDYDDKYDDRGFEHEEYEE